MKISIYTGSSLLALLCFANSALAQEATPPPSNAADSGQLTDIVVTAQRRAENLQRVPIAITALNSAQLKASGINTTKDLTSVVPGLVVGDQAGIVQPAIRGVTTTSGGAGIENSVATYIDGVYIASIPGSLLGLSGVERIEVLRGPQGTLFGRNATGGLISVITKDPSKQFSGEASLGYGNYQTITGNLYASGPLSDRLGASLAFSGTHMGDGYGTNFHTGHDTNQVKRDISVRNKWMLDLGSTKARLALDYSNQLSSYTLVGAYPQRAILYGPRTIGKVWDIDQTIDPYHSLESGGASLRIDHDLGFANLASITAYRGMNFTQYFDFDTGPQPATKIRYQNNDRQFSQELQLQKSSCRFKWVLGGFYFHSTSRYMPYIQYRDAPLTKGSTVINSRVSADSLAAFGQASYTLAGGTEFTAGLRYTTEKRGVTGQQEVFDGNDNSLGLSYAPVDQSKRFNKLTWRLAVSQPIGQSSMLYASYNRGFKAGSFNGQGPNLPAFNPEVLDAYEVGLKTDLLDRHLRINIAGFYYDYNDIQVRTFVNGTSRIYNGAKSRQYGVDIDLTAAVNSRLSFTGAFEIMHDRFVDFPAAVISTPQPNGSNLTAPGSATGNRLPFTPDWTAAVGAHYKHPIRNGNITLNLDFTHNDGYYSEPDNVLHQPSFDMLGGSLVWTTDSGYNVSVWGKNLTNAKVASLIATTPVSTLAAYQAPLTFGATIGVKF